MSAPIRMESARSVCRGHEILTRGARSRGRTSPSIRLRADRYLVRRDWRMIGPASGRELGSADPPDRASSRPGRRPLCRVQSASEMVQDSRVDEASLPRASSSTFLRQCAHAVSLRALLAARLRARNPRIHTPLIERETGNCDSGVTERFLMLPAKVADAGSVARPRSWPVTGRPTVTDHRARAPDCGDRVGSGPPGRPFLQEERARAVDEPPTLPYPRFAGIPYSATLGTRRNRMSHLRRIFAPVLVAAFWFSRCPRSVRGTPLPDVTSAVTLTWRAGRPFGDQGALSAQPGTGRSDSTLTDAQGATSPLTSDLPVHFSKPVFPTDCSGCSSSPNPVLPDVTLQAGSSWSLRCLQGS